MNYRSSTAWRVPPAKAGKRVESGDSFASSADWIRLEIVERGLYKIEQSDLVGAGLLDPRSRIGDARSIRMYAGGALPLPEGLLEPRVDWMKQIAIRVAGEEDGAFDPGDRIEFYALPTDGWIGEFDPDTSRYYDYFNHPYAAKNVYWLTWGGSFEEPVQARMERVEAGEGSVEVGSAVTIATFPERIHYEKDIFQDLTRFGTDGWFWDKFSKTATEKSFRNLQTPDADTTQLSRLRIELMNYVVKLGRSSNFCGRERALFWINDAPADSMSWDSCDRPGGFIFPVVHDTVGPWVKEGGNEIRIQVKLRSWDYLSWIELGYERFFRARNGELRFRLEEPGSYRIPLAGFSDKPVSLFDVTDPFRVKELVGFSGAADTVVAHVSMGKAATYHAADASAWKSPASIEKVTPANLRNPGSGGEYVIIVYDDYFDSVARIAEHRSKEYLVKTVLLSDVYNQFSWGVRDAVAIRDFLAHAYHHWPENERPLHVLLVGDATSDFRSRVHSTFTDQLPTFFRIDPLGNDQLTYPTDDFFTYIDPDTGSVDWAPDVTIGRIPADTKDEVELILNKIVDYEANPELGTWRNRLLFLADDELKGGDANGVKGDCNFLTSHTRDTEKTARLVPQEIDRERVYLTEYPIDAAFEKPLSRAAYINWIREGFLISTYIGHGGSTKMADENLFGTPYAEADILRNDRRLHLFTAWSCSIGSFDLLDKNSLAEVLLKMEGAGSIGSFSSGAPAFGPPSATLNRLFISNLFPRGHARVPIGEAALVSKLVAGGSRIFQKINDEKYNLLGDPALALGVPLMEVRFRDRESIELRRGDVFTLVGDVYDSDTTVAAWFNGDAFVTVRGMADSSGYHYQDSLCRGNPGSPAPGYVSYTLHGPTFFRGHVDVVQGQFSAPFFVPLDTRVGDLGRITAYVQSPGSTADGSGGYDSVRVSPEHAGFIPEDQKGPRVSITVDGDPARDGLSFTKESVFRIALEDESGINLQQSDDFFTIHIVFDEGRPIDLSSLFAYEKNSFQQGELSFRFDDLPGVSLREGGHDLAFRAADNLNNRTEVEHEMILVSEGSFLAFRREILNYPNPFNPDLEETRFAVELTQSADLTIQVLTPTGKLVREFKNCPASTSPAPLEVCAWNGRDTDGDVVANGVYLIRVIAKRQSEKAETVGKAVVLRGVN